MHKREYPKLPMVGVGGVVISGGRVLLVRRSTEPARGEWTIAGGLLEVGETLSEGVARELYEETGLTVRALELIEVVELVFDSGTSAFREETSIAPAEQHAGPKYHYVILDYLCELLRGEPSLREEISSFAFVSEEELRQYALRPETVRVVAKAFAMARARNLS